MVFSYRRSVSALAVTACLAPAVVAQGTVTVLGNGSAEAVSADGSTVVGNSPSGPTVWFTAGGAMLIGEEAAADVSADGSIVTGQMDDTGLSAAGRYTGSWTSLSGIDGTGCDFSLSSAYAMSDDGNTIVGLGWEGCQGRAFKWTPGDGMVALPQLGPNSARANGISGDGSTIGGWDEGPTGPRRASIWFPDGTEEIILEGTPMNAEGIGETYGLSTDGTYACGSSAAGLGPFLWSEANGPMDLGLAAPLSFFDVSLALAVNDAGNCVIGGQGSNFGTPFRATIWTPKGGNQFLVDYLVDLGVTIPPGLPADQFALGLATDMTPDGRTICGWSGDFFTGFTAWTVTLDDAECFLVIGTSPGDDVFDPGVHPWDTQVESIEEYYAVLLDDIPEFVLPSLDPTLTPIPGDMSGGVASTDGPLRIEPGPFAVQVVMWNPGVFPDQPEQFTYGLLGYVFPTGKVVSRPYGTGTGMEIWHELGVNDRGQPVVRFPFSIPGIE